MTEDKKVFQPVNVFQLQDYKGSFYYRKQLGKTANGSWVNLGYLKTIVERGYEERLAAVALK